MFYTNNNKVRFSAETEDLWMGLMYVTGQLVWNFGLPNEEVNQLPISLIIDTPDPVESCSRFTDGNALRDVFCQSALKRVLCEVVV